MRQSAILLLVALAGIIGGAALIGVAAIGVAIIFDSLALGAYALLHDDGVPSVPQVREVPSLHSILERARAS